MKIAVTVKGYIDVPDYWDKEPYITALEIAEFRYNEQLTEEDALNELARKMAAYPDDIEVSAEWPGEGKGI